MRYSIALLGTLCLYAQSHREHTSTDALQKELQQLMKNYTDVTGYSMSLGYVDATRDFGLGAGQRDPDGFGEIIGGNASSQDRFLFGSGTKPFTASAILRLVEHGRISSLDDKVAKYADVVLENMNGSGTTLVGLLGDIAGNVTIEHILRMQSGIADFDVPTFDNYILETAQEVHSPLEVLEYIHTLNDTICNASRSGECPCRFMCEPGTCVSYSSTNYVLAGLVLAGATATSAEFESSQYLWEIFDMSAVLGLRTNPAFRGSHFEFAVKDPLYKNGLTVAGSSIQYGKAELWEQDASVLGWTCGNCIASAHDVARFYYQLLGPKPSIVSAANVEMMKQFKTLNAGWAAGGIDYGLGLMIQNVSPLQRSSEHKPPQINASASYVGHAGDTYAFQSDNGFFPAFNASISVVLNQDTASPQSCITCHVLQVIAKHLGSSEDFGCSPIPAVAMYECATVFGEKVCVESTSHHATLTHSVCNQTCV